MATNWLGFQAKIKGFNKDALNKCNQVKRMAALGLFRAVIHDTPVDTGRLRGNWNTNVGLTDLSTNDSLREAQAIARMMQVVQSSKLQDMLVMSNNMVYAEFVEYHNCRKHGEMHAMLRKNVAKFNDFVRIARLAVQ